MLPATMKAHRIAIPAVMNILRRLSIIIASPILQASQTSFCSAKERLYDRITASPHAGATGNLGNNGTRQSFIKGFAAS